jgi:hypothetical protein
VFSNGDAVPLSLTDRGQISMQDHKLIKGALEGKSYRYYVNSTVTPARCPDGMYTLLWNWQNE